MIELIFIQSALIFRLKKIFY